MAGPGDSYTRIVGWLKISLPLAALGLLSTVFLLSNGPDASHSVPFADLDFADDGGLAERVLRPDFAGATRDGNLISFQAKSARPIGALQQLDMDGFHGEVKFSDGRSIDIKAVNALVDQTAETATFSGGVEILTGTGFLVTTQDLVAGYAQLYAESGGEIRGEGPKGRIIAGKMRLMTPDARGDAYLVFTNGVKLVYEPSSDQGPSSD